MTPYWIYRIGKSSPVPLGCPSDRYYLGTTVGEGETGETRVQKTLSYSLNSTFTRRFTGTITAKKENIELINAYRKPSKNDNLKNNK